MANSPNHASFISRYKKLSRVLVNEVLVSSTLLQSTTKRIDIKNIDARPYKALWDTGATNCVITQKIVDDLGLKPTSMTKVSTVSEEDVDAEVFLVSIFLPNKVCIPNIHVTKGRVKGYDMLIGMDIINKGDLAVTNHQGKTSFSFRMPSSSEIDFTKPSPPVLSSKIPRNSPCSCGSGKKYKKCCGKT